MWPMMVVWGSEMARSRRCVCALRSSLKRPWMLATTKSKRSQHVVRIVQRPVGQNVGLDAFEDPEILAEALVQPVGFPVLLRDLFHRETARIVRGLGMIGDAEILEAALARGLGHRLQGLCAVGGIGVAMKDSAQVLVGDELRQLALQGQLDLAAALTEFRIDEGQTESAIDLGLVAGDQGAALVQAVGLQPHSFLSGQRLELLNVSGGAGGEKKGGAEVFAIGHADLQSIRRGSLRRFVRPWAPLQRS